MLLWVLSRWRLRVRARVKTLCLFTLTTSFVVFFVLKLCLRTAGKATRTEGNTEVEAAKVPSTAMLVFVPSICFQTLKIVT